MVEIENSRKRGRKEEIQENLRGAKLSRSESFLTETGRTIKDQELEGKQKQEMPQAVISKGPKNIENSDPEKICGMCCLRAKDATFVHGNISHQVCCYVCAKMIFKSRGTCPVCRRKIEKITKNIVV